MNIQITKTLSIRLTLEGDIDFVRREESKNENSIYVGQWTKEEHLKSLFNDGVRHLIVEENFNPIGYLILSETLNKKIIEIKRIVISEKNKGIGTLVLKALIEYYFKSFDSERI